MQELVCLQNSRTRTWLFECSKQSLCRRLSSTRSRGSWAFDLEWVSDFYWLELLSVVVDDYLMLTWKLMCIHGDGILISWFKGVYQFMSVWLIFPLCFPSGSRLKEVYLKSGWRFHTIWMAWGLFSVLPFKICQCPLLALLVHGPQMVWECVCVHV